MRLDARDENWLPMTIRGVEGYFSDMRIKRDTVPEIFKFWELADGDCNGIPCRYRQGILVNFFGTFITLGDLPIDDNEFKEGFIEEDQYYFTGSSYIDFHEVLKEIKE